MAKNELGIPSTVDFTIESNGNSILLRIWSNVYYTKERPKKSNKPYDGQIKFNGKQRHFHSASEMLYQVFKHIGISPDKMLVLDNNSGDSSYFSNMWQFLQIIEARYYTEEKKRFFQLIDEGKI